MFRGSCDGAGPRTCCMIVLLAGRTLAEARSDPNRMLQRTYSDISSPPPRTQGTRDLLCQERRRKRLERRRLHEIPLYITRPHKRLRLYLLHLARRDGLDRVVDADGEGDARDELFVEHGEVGETREDVPVEGVSE